VLNRTVLVAGGGVGVGSALGNCLLGSTKFDFRLSREPQGTVEGTVITATVTSLSIVVPLVPSFSASSKEDLMSLSSSETKLFFLSYRTILAGN